MILSKGIPPKPPKGRSSLLLGTCLTLAGLVLIPALAQRMGIGAGLTGALRVAAMRASRQV